MQNNSTVSTASSTKVRQRGQRFAAIIFDMDGLLVDSEIIWEEAETALMTARGHSFSSADRSDIVGLRVDEFLDQLRLRYKMPETLEVLVQELNDRMLELIPVRVVAHPGAEEILQYVVQNNILRAIASNSPMSIIDQTVSAQGWEHIFQVRCSGDDEVQGKPAPHVYLTAARRLGVDPSKCLALEDSVNGAKAVVAAGMTCFAVPDRSHSNPAKFAEITPYVFSDLHEVLSWLQEPDTEDER
jgi:mannitol-1-/sugar-/sorbitol-6-/2-deoxyglucose-6-phosphatase